MRKPLPLLIGYARVSTDGQTLDQQRAALKAAGCKRVFEEKASGAQRGRRELAKMLDHLQPGNVVTVTRLDRLARSTRDLLDIAGAPWESLQYYPLRDFWCDGKQMISA